MTTIARLLTRRIAAAAMLLPLMVATSGCMAPTPSASPSTGAAKTAAPTTQAPAASRADTSKVTALPPMKVFYGDGPMARPRIANADLARDFIDLSFRLESGREMPVFTRFEGPIRVGLTGKVPPGMARELDNVIGRLRREAGIDITRLPMGQTGNITINAVPGDRIRRELPAAACFVVPGISRLSEYRSARRSARTDWTRLKERDQIAIFVPSDAAPQEMRDCLHEELAQSLGPLNDLYRLAGSTFNDDNIQSVLTGYDMMILRITYAPELQSGMTRKAVAARLPGVLARVNPDGGFVPPRVMAETPVEWVRALSQALGPDGSPATRLRGAERAVAIAEGQGWNDHRTAFANYVLGRLLQIRDPKRAEAALLRAHSLFGQHPETRIHAAHTAVQLAAHAISRGESARALALLKGQDAIAERYQNAVLLANIKMLRAEAQDLAGQTAAARASRLDSLGWARYGFGPDAAVEARLRDVAALAPRGG
ncbi:DUF2927 domain-containing protein [Pseudooceanicola marinus]|uniref:DUF2927 domain-containing protein n=1 Tax=Pseudooceanicola marinus TaxID=396013 RepID=UPI001CD5979A|nr:DUF2927 domain-containing protein [Pseudooceanicola marinus]MCA1334167.1 DUF2927 domain-containing protein [Pseudooceanicola marinus]